MSHFQRGNYELYLNNKVEKVHWDFKQNKIKF